MRLSGVVVRQHLLQGLYDDMDDLDVLLLVMAAYVVGLEQLSLLLDHVDGLGVVLHVEPVPDVLAVSVHGELPALQTVVDDQGDQLLRELIGAVVVGAVGDVGRETVGVHIGLHQHVRPRLAGGIGAVGIVGRVLIEERAVVIRQGAVHLVRGHMQELLPRLEAALRQLPGLLCAVEHHRRAQHIGAHEHLGFPDAPVHMALRREMHHTVDVVLREYPGDGLLVADVRLHEAVVRIALQALQVLQIARVGQKVHVDDADVVTVFPEHIMDIVGADETGASCHKISTHFLSPSFG